MDIHKPKPVHNWRELLSEIGVVVIGIVIALTLEEGVRALHDAQTTREARRAVYQEIRQNLSFMSSRLATEACIEQRLDEVGDILAASGDGELVRKTSWVSQPSVFYLSDQRWQAATGSGRTSLLTPDEQDRLAGHYIVSARFNDAERAEQAAWAQLRGLESWKGPLGPVGHVHFLEALQQARYELWEIRIAMGIAQRRAKALGLAGAPPRTMVSGYKLPHAICLPIDTPRDQAAAILSRDGSPPWGQPK